MPMLTNKALPTITDPGHTAQFTICSTESSFLPVIRFRVTDSSVTLPLVEIKLLELNCGILHLTRDSYHGTQTHKAILIDKCDEYINTTDTSYSLSSVTHFDASYCSLCPVHLEQLSDACPNLKRLDLYGNSQCLNSLEGLYSLAIHCKRLHALNLWCIDEPDRRYTCSQLWEVLCTMHLIFISIEIWMVNNVDSNMFQNYTSLKVLEVKGRFSCTTDMSLLGSCFPSVTSYRVCSNGKDDGTYVHTLEHIVSYKYLSIYRYLKCLFLHNCLCWICFDTLEVHCPNLQQLYIRAHCLDLPDNFIGDPTKLEYVITP